MIRVTYRGRESFGHCSINTHTHILMYTHAKQKSRCCGLFLTFFLILESRWWLIRLKHHFLICRHFIRLIFRELYWHKKVKVNSFLFVLDNYNLKSNRPSRYYTLLLFSGVPNSCDDFSLFFHNCKQIETFANAVWHADIHLYYEYFNAYYLGSG